MKRNLLLSLLVLLLLTVLGSSLLITKEKDEEKEEEKSYTAPYVLVEGPTEVEVGSTHTYTGHLIVSKVDKEGNVIEEEVASASVEQSFPNPGNYTVTIEIQGYTGSLSVEVKVAALSVSVEVSSDPDPPILDPAHDIKSVEVTFTASASGGTGSYVYSWSGAVSGSEESASGSFSNVGTVSGNVEVTTTTQEKATGAGSITIYQLTSKPCWRELPGKPGRPHYGYDWWAPEGSDVCAMKSGVVLDRGVGVLEGYYVVINNDDGTQSQYFHLSSVEVSEGDSVEEGDKIGEVGSTGEDVSGPHLHYGEKDKPWGKWIDPYTGEVIVCSEETKPKEPPPIKVN